MAHDTHNHPGHARIKGTRVCIADEVLAEFPDGIAFEDIRMLLARALNDRDWKNDPEIPFRRDWSFEPGEDIAVWDGPQLVAVIRSDQPHRLETIRFERGVVTRPRR